MNPYVGLTHFTEEDRDRFFGRETESALIIGNLRASRLTLLYAESGVGKSSVLRAGVVARLHEFAARDMRGRDTPRLLPVVFSAWSEKPVPALIGAIGAAARPYLAEGELPALPEGDLPGALETVGEALDATLLVILDQFEEYFLYPDTAPEEERIAAQLARCVNRPELRANFLISIREDAYAELGDLFRGKVKNVYGNFLHLDFLGREGAREAIEKPLERVEGERPDGESFTAEPSLVDAVLDQVSHDESGQRIETTYLQLVMRRLWEEEARAGSRILRLQTLERLGGAQAIIGNHLDRAMEGGEGSDGLNHGQRLIAASIFRFLVTSGGTKIALSARDLADLSGIAIAEVDPVLQHLSSPSLHILRPVVYEGGESEPRFEIFHDALAGPILEWRARTEEEEREARLERERVEKEEAQRAAAEAERQALRERQRKRVAQGLLAVTVLALLAGAAVFAIKQKSVADQRQADGESARAAERIAELAQAPSFGPGAAALASVEAYRLSPTAEAREQSLAQLQRNPGLPQISAGHTRAATAVAYWPGSTNFASGSQDWTVRLWNARGEELGSPLFVHAEADVLGLAVSKPRSDGTRIVAAGLEERGVELWKVQESGSAKRLPPLHVSKPGEIWGVAFDPRWPDVLAVGGTEGRVTLWDLRNPAHPRSLGARRLPGEVFDLAFASGGRRLLVADNGAAEALRVSPAGLGAALPLRTAGGAVAVASAPNGSYAFSNGDRIRVWDAHRRRELRLRAANEVDALAFAGGGSVLVSAGEDWNVTTWDLASGRPFGPPRIADRASVRDVAVSPDGETIAAAGEDSLVRLWPLRPKHALAATVGSLSLAETGGGQPEIEDLAVGSGGRVAVAGASAGTSIWSLRGLAAPDSASEPLARMEGHSAAVAYLGNVLVAAKGSSFVVYGTGGACGEASADPCRLGAPRRPHSAKAVESLELRRYGSRLLLASTGHRPGASEEVLNLWDLSSVATSGKVVHLSSRRLGTYAEDLALDPARPLVAVAARDGKLRIWDAGDPRHLESVAIEHPRGNENQPIETVAFSPDGSLLASGGTNQQVVLWRVGEDGSGHLIVKATPGTMMQGESITSVAFDPDGRILAAGDAEGVTCLYEVESRRSIGGRSCLLGHNGPINAIEALAFAHLPSGAEVLLTAGVRQPIVAWSSLLWDAGGGDGVEEEIAGDACTLAGRNLTEDQWDSAFASTGLVGKRRRTCPQLP